MGRIKKTRGWRTSARWSLGIGFALLLISIGAAFVLSKRGGTISLVIGLVILLWIIIVTIRRHIGPQVVVLNFSAQIQIRLSSPRNQAAFWLVHPYGAKNVTLVASPITDVLFLRLTNASEAPPLFIDYYGIEVRSEMKGWQAVTLFRAFDVRNGHVFHAVGSPADAPEVIFPQPLLEDVITERNIGPGETVRGLILIERPAGYEGDDQRLEWRLTIRDVKLGADGTAIVGKPKGSSDLKSLTSLSFSWGKRQDISAVPRLYYSERGKLPY